MNYIENYLLYRSRTLSKSLPANFIIGMLGTMAAFGTVISLSAVFQPKAVFAIAESAVFDQPLSMVPLFIESISASVLSLALLYVSCYTVFAHRIMFFLCMWRGASLGCAVSAVSSGLLIAPPENLTAVLMVYFLSATAFVLLASYARIYADCILRTCIAEERRYRRSVTREFSVCFMTFSGIILSADMIRLILLHS